MSDELFNACLVLFSLVEKRALSPGGNLWTLFMRFQEEVILREEQDRRLYGRI